MPEEQQAAAIRQLLGVPPDFPIIEAEAVESPTADNHLPVSESTVAEMNSAIERVSTEP